MKKIYISLSVIAAVAAVVVGATTAFYSDTEVSSGNVLKAGEIDLKVDNHAWYNGVLQPRHTWELTDLGEAHQFFDLRDLKPGDWEEDTISLHVNSNDAWLCADVTLRTNDDNGSTEPELESPDALDNPNDLTDGELAQHLKWYWWADDGDNVFEDDETLLNNGVSFPGVGNYPVTLADSQTNLWGQQDEDIAVDPVIGGETYYLGKAFCFGNGIFGEGYPSQVENENDQMVDDNSDPSKRPVRCDGSLEGNVTQTDMMTLDIAFRAVQARHNDAFLCQGGVN